MKKAIGVVLSIVFIFTFIFTAVAADSSESLPSPDWVQVTPNRGSTKTVSINTPIYLLDTVVEYKYSTDGGNEWKTINNNSGGELIIYESCEFSLKYITADGEESPVYSVSVEIKKNTVVTSSSTGISIIIPEGSATPTDIKLSAYEIISGIDYTAIQQKIGKNHRIAVYSVTIMRNNSVFNSAEDKNWMLPIGDFDNRYCKLYRVDSNGNLSLVDSETEMNMLYASTPLSGIFVVTEDKTYSVGDVDGDAKITAADARKTLRHAAKIELIASEHLSSADANGDGTVTSADARLILRAAAGLEKL